MVTGKMGSDRLAKLSSGPEVVDLLVDSGFDLSRIVRDQVGSVDDTGVLLVGSVAEGFHNRASDVDLMFLTHLGQHEAPACPELFLEAGASQESLIYHGGIEVNTEVIFFDAYRSLAESFGQMLQALATGEELQRLALFDDFSLRLLHRLRTGITLQGDDVVERFREQFNVDSLPLYLSVVHLVNAREFLEDARTSSHGTPGLVEYVCREVTENCLLALAAARGFTSQTHRFVMSWIDSSVGFEEETDRALREIQMSLLNRRAVPGGQKVDLVDECVRQFAWTETVLRSDPLRMGVIDQVFAQMSYAD